MWPFRKKSEELDTLQLYLQQSFSGVQNDTQRLYQWMHYLFQKTQQQDQVIHYLQQQLHSLPEPKAQEINPQEIRNIIDSHFSLQELQQRILFMQNHLEEIKNSHGEHNERISALQSRIDAIKERVVAEQKTVREKPKKRAHFREKIVKNITKHSKSYLKSMLHNLINKYQKITALQLKEIMVDEQKLCSKSSFYRLLEEIEQDNIFGVLKDNRQKFFLSKPIKTSR